MVAITTALKKIASLNGKIIIVQGGTRAGKTYAILLLIIDYCLRYPNKRIGVFSHSYPHLARGAINDFLFILQELELFDVYSWNSTKHIYTFFNNSRVEFITAENVGSIQGTQYNLTFVNEARYVKQEVFNQILIRTIFRCYIDFNPTSKFYVHDLLTRHDVSFIKITYKDNECCPPSIAEEMEHIGRLAESSSYWANYKRVYVDGEIGGSLDQVYPDWRLAMTLPAAAKLIAVGVDFGFTNDETAIVAIYYADNGYYLKELACKRMMTTDKIAEVLKNYKCNVYCDAAEPRTIAELNRLLKTNRCKGVKYNVVESIDRIRRENVYVLAECKELINEHQNYIYKRDRYTGELTNEPIGVNNHRMDAIRYGLCGYFEHEKFGYYQKRF